MLSGCRVIRNRDLEETRSGEGAIVSSTLVDIKPTVMAIGHEQSSQHSLLAAGCGSELFNLPWQSASSINMEELSVWLEAVFFESWSAQENARATGAWSTNSITKMAAIPLLIC